MDIWDIIKIVKLAILLVLLLLLIPCCKKKAQGESEDNSIWDIDKKGIPKFVEVNYIELSQIGRISKFRSSVGHDYSDAFEHCRSMKHYFEPLSTTDWSSIKIFAPISGVITRVENEWAGTKIEIASAIYPAFRISIFHVKLNLALKVGDQVEKSAFLGTHIGSQTMSDISVIVNDPSRQGRMVSFFEVLTDQVFSEFYARGIDNRASMIIPKNMRDANPLNCNGDVFINTDTLVNWVQLK
jgi:hypothetical protein